MRQFLKESGLPRAANSFLSDTDGKISNSTGIRSILSDLDVGLLVDLGQKMHKESDFSRHPYDTDVAASFIRLHIGNPDRLGLIAISNGRPIGMLLAQLEQFLFSRKTIASESIWFVDKQYRGSMTAVRLLQQFEHWANSRGASEICVGISTAVSVDRTSGILKRLGYRNVGSIWKK